MQAIQLLWDIHNRGILHRDIKPENLLVHQNKLHLIDFGLSKKFLDESNAHIPRLENKQFRGTLRYASTNMHQGIENTRRDDLESLGYVLIYLAKGSLPWQGLKIKSGDRAQAIAKIKMKTQLKALCSGLPMEFVEFMRGIKNLGFAEEPDYVGYMQLFGRILQRVE